MKLFIALLVSLSLTIVGCSSQPKAKVAARNVAVPAGHTVLIEGADVTGKNGAVRFRIIGPKGDKDFRDFSVYMQGKNALTDWRLLCSDPVFELLNGWALLCGRYPVANTKRVTAVGTGTTMVVEIDEVNDVHRVYLLPDSPLGTVEMTAGIYMETLTKPRSFREVDARLNISEEKLLDDKNPDGSLKYPDQVRFIDTIAIPESNLMH